MEIITKPIEYRKESATERARRLIQRKLEELRFKSLPKKIQKKLIEEGLDPASRHDEERKEYR